MQSSWGGCHPLGKPNPSHNPGLFCPHGGGPTSAERGNTGRQGAGRPDTVHPHHQVGQTQSTLTIRSGSAVLVRTARVLLSLLDAGHGHMAGIQYRGDMSYSIIIRCGPWPYGMLVRCGACVVCSSDEGHGHQMQRMAIVLASRERITTARVVGVMVKSNLAHSLTRISFTFALLHPSLDSCH